MSQLPTVRDEIDRFLRTGSHDAQSGAWPGSFLSREQDAARDLRSALITEVRNRSFGRRTLPNPVDVDFTAMTRQKIAPMVLGLFPESERDLVQKLLERSTVVVTAANIDQIIESANWLYTAWALANLYLGSIGAELLGPDAPSIVGLSEETRCYLSTDYWSDSDRFADFLVHETAHAFHNCKRTTAGLRETRRREWLLDIDFGKRETFAYACEAYSRLIELSSAKADRRKLFAELLDHEPPPDDRVDADEYMAILREAVEARNGWKRILARCSPFETSSKMTA
jgi:hypothetical protein